MRLIKNYVFDIGTKIPFSEWPEIVRSFLAENHLSSHRFLYFFKDIIGYHETKEEALPRSGCSKILKDCPSLGEIRYHNGKAHGRSDHLFLSNIDGQDDFPESRLQPLMKKIHRRYGLCECTLYYYDIDFFGIRTHFERDYSVALRMSKSDEIPFDPTLYMDYQPYGSGISIHRDVCGINYLVLSVDILHDGVMMDASPYYEAMQKLLPQIKASSSISIYLSDEEKRRVEEINQVAEPVLQKSRDFFAERLSSVPRQNYFSSNYSLARPLKKLAKKYGYTYVGAWKLEKRTAKGSVIYINADSGPSHYSLEAFVIYQGLGFHHHLGYSRQTPRNQQEADAVLEDIFLVLSEFEETLLPELDSFFPETPSWFKPSIFPNF